jgi:hypothetical protein
MNRDLRRRNAVMARHNQFVADYVRQQSHRPPLQSQGASFTTFFTATSTSKGLYEESK